jgi:excisionase family DNA binding protein
VAGGDDGLLLGEAARALGVSPDTLRRWERSGKLRATRDSVNRRRVSREELQRLGGGAAGNRIPGVVRSVRTGGVIALVEVETGPHTVVAAVPRRDAEDLAPGDPVTAAVPAMSVQIEQVEDDE